MERRNKVVIDDSLIRPWLDRFYFKPLIRFVPRFISPNSITISGLAACLGVLAMLAHYRRPGPLLALACGLVVHYYTIADQLDGMQARRLNRTSELGAFLDHACDFANGQIIIWATFQFADLPWYLLVATSSAYTIVFLTSHFEHRVRGILHFGVIGPVEGLLASTAFFLVSSIVPKAWTTPLVAQFTAGYLIILLFFGGLVWTSLLAGLRLRHVFTLACGIELLTVCIAGAAALWSKGNAQLFWDIELTCSAIYGLRSLYGASVVVRRLAVFPAALMSVFVVVLVKMGSVADPIEAEAAYLILGYLLLVLLAVGRDACQFFSSARLGDAAATQPRFHNQ